MSTTTSLSDPDEYQESNSEGESSDQPMRKPETRLFWSDGHVMGQQYEGLQAPEFNAVEAGYLADDETDTEDDPRISIKPRQAPLACSCSMSSSLFHSDSDGFEERAVL